MSPEYMKHLKTWQLIHQSLIQKVPVMLLYVLESKGSSPGRPGFFMAVNTDGEMEGSIGGGIMEHKFVEMVKEKLLADSDEPLAGNIRKQHHDKSAVKNQSGMICSGEQTILLYKIKDPEKTFVQQIILSLEENRNGTLLLAPGKLSFDNAPPERDIDFTFTSEEDWQYKEKTGYKNHLFIIGGGHCSLAFSRLMRSMDFYTCIYDERTGLKTMVENSAAHEKHVVSDYSVLKELISSGNNHYVVIMTFGYHTDDIALRALIGKDFKYIGLLGSRHKTEKMLADYHKEGIAAERLQRIHSPVGLAIKSQTPEEIAVSIAAEIIKTKNYDL